MMQTMVRACEGSGCKVGAMAFSRFCERCWESDRAREAAARKVRAAECWARGEAARVAMPEAAKWCARAAEVGTVHYLVPHVARSGMSRRIELFVSMPDGGIEPFWPDREPETKPGESVKEFRARAKAYKETFRRLSWSWKHRCFVVGGCGMDMVFATMDGIGDVFGYYDFGNTIQRRGLSRAE